MGEFVIQVPNRRFVPRHKVTIVQHMFLTVKCARSHLTVKCASVAPWLESGLLSKTDSSLFCLTRSLAASIACGNGPVLLSPRPWLLVACSASTASLPSSAVKEVDHSREAMWGLVSCFRFSARPWPALQCDETFSHSQPRLRNCQRWRFTAQLDDIVATLKGSFPHH